MHFLVQSDLRTIFWVFKKAGLRQWLSIWPTIGLPYGVPLACLLAYPWAYMSRKLGGHVLQYRRTRATVQKGT